MKKCPFCAEEIQDEAIKCRYCGEFFDGSHIRPPAFPSESAKAPTKAQHSTVAIIFALACLGPLALPMVWSHPRYKIRTKLIITIIVIAVTVFLCVLVIQLYSRLSQQVLDMVK